MMKLTDILWESAFDNMQYSMAGFKHDQKTVSYNKLYHTTPIKLSDIKSDGLLPNKPSRTEPLAVYATSDLIEAVRLSRHLYISKRIKSDWYIYLIQSTGLKLFSDPFAVKEMGVYTYDPIPKRLIH